MSASLSLMRQILSLEIRKILSYRVDFWLNFFGVILVEFGLAYFLWKAIFEYRGVRSIEGYTFQAMMLYYILVPTISHIIQAQVMHFISTEIYEGSLTRYLIYPISFLSYKLIAHYAFSLIAVVQFCCVLGLYSLMDLFVLLPFVVNGLFLHYLIGVLFVLPVFWTHSQRGLGFVFFTISRFMERPDRIFTGMTRLVLTTVLPLSLIASFPARIFFDGLNFQIAAHMGVVTLAFMLLVAAVWQLGLRVYASASS